MKTAGITQDALAEKMAVTQGAIAHWLNGRRKINLTEFFKLCEKAGADPQAILFAPPLTEAGEVERLFTTKPWLREVILRAASIDGAMSETLPPRILARAKSSKARKRKSLKNPS